jgi:hypothetical protein
LGAHVNQKRYEDEYRVVKAQKNYGCGTTGGAQSEVAIASKMANKMRCATKFGDFP